VILPVFTGVSSYKAPRAIVPSTGRRELMLLVQKDFASPFADEAWVGAPYPGTLESVVGGHIAAFAKHRHHRDDTETEDKEEIAHGFPSTTSTMPVAGRFQQFAGVNFRCFGSLASITMKKPS
jgi:hypothetical protein